MPGYYGVKLGRHWNGLKIEIWDLHDLHINAVYLVSKGEIIFILKIIKTYRAPKQGVCQSALVLVAALILSPSIIQPPKCHFP